MALFCDARPPARWCARLPFEDFRKIQSYGFRSRTILWLAFSSFGHGI